MTDSPAPRPASADLTGTLNAAYEAVEGLLSFTPAQTGRFGGWTPDRQRQFIVALAATGTVERSCRAVGMTVQGAYKLRKRADANEFAHAWDAALAQGRERVFSLAIDRAINGYTRPRFYRGRQVGTIHQYDNRMAMHALNPPMPPTARQAPPRPSSPAEAYLRDLDLRLALEQAMAAIGDAPGEEGEVV